MTHRLRVVHRTGFHYEAPVPASYNEARMTPLTTAGQARLDSRIEVEPVTWTHSYQDYWGTQVTAFDVLTPHADLTVVSNSTVEVFAPHPPRQQIGWDVLARDDVRDAQVEALTQSEWTRPQEQVLALARDAAGDLPPDAAARAVCARIFEQVDYVPGSTSVHTNAAQVWQARQGVCQDYAHLVLGALRGLGIPARYVSGYLHPLPDAEVGEPVAGQSHAWVEWWAGEWIGFDPTHDAPVGQDHVVVARARDYSDVTPLKGVYAGAASSQLFVSVEVTRLA